MWVPTTDFSFFNEVPNENASLLNQHFWVNIYLLVFSEQAGEMNMGIEQVLRRHRRSL